MMWRRKVAFELQAAALATAALLATPYLYVYDLVVLAIPMAFLIRAARAQRISARRDRVACRREPVHPAVSGRPCPIGLAAVLIVAMLVIRRAYCPSGQVNPHPDAAGSSCRVTRFMLRRDRASG